MLPVEPKEKTMEEKKPQDDSKSLKKLLESHMTVMNGKLGRTPSMEELVESLNDNMPEKQEEKPTEESIEGEPKILKLKVYYGMSNQSPDKGKILFYETADGKTFDCSNQSWMGTRPEILDHLPNRPIEYDEDGRDVMRAIVNGVVDDDDYSELDKSGLLNNDNKKIYSLCKNVGELKGQMQTLEKSQEEQIPSQELNESPVMQNPTQVVPGNAKPLTPDVAGDDLIAQIMQSAMAEVKILTTEMVHQEIVKYIQPLTDAVHTIASHLGLIEQDFDMDEENDLTEIPDDDIIVE